MKRFICSTALFLIPLVLLSQAGAPDPDVVPIYGDVSIHTIERSPGAIEILILVILGLINLSGLPLGITAIVASSKTEKLQMPLSVILLPCGTAFLFILGFLGAVHCIIQTVILLGTTTGAAKQAYLNLELSQAFSIPSFALQGAFFYMLFFIITIIILHFKHKKIMNRNEYCR